MRYDELRMALCTPDKKKMEKSINMANFINLIFCNWAVRREAFQVFNYVKFEDLVPDGGRRARDPIMISGFHRTHIYIFYQFTIFAYE